MNGRRRRAQRVIICRFVAHSFTPSSYHMPHSNYRPRLTHILAGRLARLMACGLIGWAFTSCPISRGPKSSHPKRHGSLRMRDKTFGSWDHNHMIRFQTATPAISDWGRPVGPLHANFPSSHHYDWLVSRCWGFTGKMNVSLGNIEGGTGQGLWLDQPSLGIHG